MCGIFGIFNHGVAAPAPPLDLLAHRGPDDEGRWISPDRSVCFGHTRLAIIDLSPTGAQPMIDPETGNVIVFNGEIYNHREIRASPSMADVEWVGTSDTETILRGYSVHGLGVIEQLKGMFAFAVYDAAKGQLVLARDRFGIKPLYFVNHASGLAFASEVRAIRRYLPVVPTAASISSYLSVGACPEEELLFPAIESLAAGSVLTLSSNLELRRRSYWTPRLQTWPFPDGNGGVSPAQRIRRLLEKSVEEHLLSDVPVASFLSGGIDSSIITALAARHYPRQLATFSVGFAQGEFDETATAAEVAARCGTKHSRIELAMEEVIAMVGEAVTKMDLPSIDAINTFVVSKAVARAGIKVALSGLGGDELFGGYPSFTDVRRLRVISRLPGFARSMLSWSGSKLGRRLAAMPATEDAGELAAWRRVFWTADMIRAAGLPLREFNVETPSGLSDDFGKVSWAELTRYMRHTLLRDSDQMSMAVGLELRVPFLDHELVEAILSLPEAEKKKHPGVKGLLVEACRDLLPVAVYNRPKMGFALPMDVWMRGPLAAFVSRGLELLEESGTVSAVTVRGAQQAFAARSLHWTRLWALVVLGHYLSRQGVRFSRFGG